MKSTKVNITNTQSKLDKQESSFADYKKEKLNKKSNVHDENTKVMTPKVSKQTSLLKNTAKPTGPKVMAVPMKSKNLNHTPMPDQKGQKTDIDKLGQVLAAEEENEVDYIVTKKRKISNDVDFDSHLNNRADLLLNQTDRAKKLSSNKKLSKDSNQEAKSKGQNKRKKGNIMVLAKKGSHNADQADLQKLRCRSQTPNKAGLVTSDEIHEYWVIDAFKKPKEQSLVNIGVLNAKNLEQLRNKGIKLGSRRTDKSPSKIL